MEKVIDDSAVVGVGVFGAGDILPDDDLLKNVMMLKGTGGSILRSRQGQKAARMSQPARRSAVGLRDAVVRKRVAESQLHGGNS